MASAAVQNVVKGEDLVLMPEDGVERWIRDGRLEERSMTTRNRDHSRVMGNLALELGLWRRSRQHPRPTVLVGGAAIRLHRDPETTYGVDVVVVSAETTAAQPRSHTIVDGTPVAAIEIVSGSQTHSDVERKVESFISAGTPQVWLVNPRNRTFIVHRPDQPLQLFNSGDVLTAESELPGFSVGVAALFE